MGIPDQLASEKLNASSLIKLLEAYSDGLYYWDRVEDKIYWSDQIFETLGYGPGPQAGLDDLTKLIHPDDKDGHTAAVMASLEEKRNHLTELRLIQKDGNYIWYRAFGVWIASETDQCSEMIGFLVNISDSKKLESDLIGSEIKFKQFLRHCPAAVYIKDEDSRHLYGNIHAAEIAGCSEEAFVGTTLEDIFDSETAAELRKVDLEVLREKKVKSWTGPTKNKIGEDKIIFDTKFPLIDEATGKTQIGGFGVDITEAKKNIDLINHHQRLESIGVLAGGVAHDFNNYLTMIMGLNSKIQKSYEKLGQKSEDFEKLKGVVNQASDLCKLLLQYAGKSSDVPEVIDLREFLNLMSHTLKLACKKSNLRIEIDHTQNLEIHFSKTMLQQILINLLINAEQATPDKGKPIELKLDLVTDFSCDQFQFAQDWTEQKVEKLVRLQVIDQGVGISPDDLKKIFDPFYTTKETGTGMGLSSLIDIIRGNHGALGVNSTVGQGSEFHLYLPASNNQ